MRKMNEQLLRPVAVAAAGLAMMSAASAASVEYCITAIQKAETPYICQGETCNPLDDASKIMVGTVLAAFGNAFGPPIHSAAGEDAAVTTESGACVVPGRAIENRTFYRLKTDQSVSASYRTFCGFFSMLPFEDGYYETYTQLIDAAKDDKGREIFSALDTACDLLQFRIVPGMDLLSEKKTNWSGEPPTAAEQGVAPTHDIPADDYDDLGGIANIADFVLVAGVGSPEEAAAAASLAPASDPALPEGEGEGEEEEEGGD